MSPVSSTGVSPSAFSPRTASALVGFTVSRTTSVARGTPSHATVIAPSCRATSTSWPSTTPRTPTPGTLRKLRHRRQRRRARRARRPRSPARSDARSPPRPRPRAAAPRHVRRRPAASTSTSSIRPSVIVPVLSSTIVPIRRVCSSTSGPLIRIPSCAPRPVPTSSAIGVASPSAHGHAMISTETAAVKAADAPPPASSQPSERRERDPDHDRDEDGRDAVGEPLHRRLAGLRLLDEPRDLRERRLGADPRRADDETAVRVDGRAGDRRSRADLDRNRLAGQQRLVDRRGSLDDDAVGRDLLAGADDEHVAGRQLLHRDEHLLAVAEQPRLLRAELEQRTDRRTAAALRAQLEEAAEQDQRRDHAGGLEVRVRVEPADQHDRRPRPGGERAERDQRVHVRGAVAGTRQRGAVEAEAAPEDDRRREREREPLPAGEVERRDHREQDERDGQRRPRRRAGG